MTPPVTMQISEIEKGFGRGDSPPGGAPGATPGGGALAWTLVWTGEGWGGTTRLGHRGIRLMKTFLLRLFTWWNGQTFGTQVWTRLYGELVGEDEFGNRYYRTRGGKTDPSLGFERRWVIFNGYAEASTIPPGWHG